MLYFPAFRPKQHAEKCRFVPKGVQIQIWIWGKPNRIPDAIRSCSGRVTEAGCQKWRAGFAG
jgi:hypothetical protein